MKKKIFFLVVFIILIIGGLRYLSPSQVTLSNKNIVSENVDFDYSKIKFDNKASLLMNLDTNQIIYQNNINEPLPVYSVSKVMFLTTLADYLQTNNISLDTKLKVKDYIEDIQENAEFSNSYIKSGYSYTIEELFEAVMLPSGNDAALFLANEIYGSHGKAVNAMNDFAKELDLKDSSFISTSGLDGKYLKEIGIKATEGKNIMSVNDLIILIKYVDDNYHFIIDMSSQPQSEIGRKNGKITLNNVNEVIESFEDGYEGVYGLKTGSNIEKYSNAIVALKSDDKDQDIMAISIGSKTRSTMKKDVSSMYDYLKTLDKVNLEEGITIDATVGFSENEINFGLKDPFILYLPKNQMFAYKLINPQYYNSNLGRFYNVNQGSVLGELEFIDGSNFFNGQAQGLSKVVVKDEIIEMNFLDKTKQFINDLIDK